MHTQNVQNRCRRVLTVGRLGERALVHPLQRYRRMSLNSAYHDKMEAQLKEISAKIDVYKAKAAKMSADAKIEIEKEIAKLRPMQETARAKLAEFKAAGSEKWEELKTGLDKAWTDLTAAVERAGRRSGSGDDDSKGKV